MTPDLIALGLVAFLFALIVIYDNRHHPHVWRDDDD